MFDLMPFDRKEMRKWNGYFDDLERSFFGGFPAVNSGSMFRADIIDRGDSYLLQAELPGFDREEISVDVCGESLTISAQHKEESKEEEKNFVRRERRFGSFVRSFDITGIDTDQISAEFKDGVLGLTLPKRVETETASKKIEIK
ncbi:MAG TPA: Hsp20/alpha crystallin family protein [Oscillospiraceae bacterium]|nr:Hsp20/alpha crystallin family protein [Oscillospiraceae bacterium]HNW04416.1 Hsp20/alpha crystallin family protein [Oscillospiraceae bacterium]HPW00027.1 Hsp20/alpha crystallin family protein [Oscillospiraceae bacterium]